MTIATPAYSNKSGIRQLKTGEILFNDGEIADSLFIIQKGQLRLFKPKGKGFIEIAVLRAGEVIGEMAYFDEDGSGKKRSCSASAMTPVEVIEITFPAFGKTMASLNPWFKTIINTLASRLRKSNGRIKELEDNHASINYGTGAAKGYEFLKPLEVMRILGTIFLVFKSHGEFHGTDVRLNRKTLTLYTSDMYQIMEVKLETVLSSLVEMGWLETRLDEEESNLLILKNLEIVRQIFIFYNGERGLPANKKINVSEKSQMLIEKILEHVKTNPPEDIPNLRKGEDIKHKFTKWINLSPIIAEFKSRNLNINADHVDDGKNIGLFGELMMEDGKAMVEFDLAKTEKLFPIIKFMNHVSRGNREKSGES